ncbi:hypothetical protein NHX12_008799 [Muraenolepis orangiensis]|uniref:PH domain-containing protein n=1 Tax=Muraenolepis orangiensis TaxID=630683 RepID=A0A9Q0DNI9_9TELE|nr:hypothetical protein NHX12_008799 [Muraenolepis orangiensis]
MFKQWREKYLVLTLEGSLCVCRDAKTPPDQVVALQFNCESIAEGREILDLPRLPAGGRRDCCFALILPQNKFLLLLADSPEDCGLWLKLLRKVREGTASPLTLQRQRSIAPCITDREALPDMACSSAPGSPHAGEMTPPPSRLVDRTGSFTERPQTAAGTHRRSLRGLASATPPPHRLSSATPPPHRLSFATPPPHRLSSATPPPHRLSLATPPPRRLSAAPPPSSRVSDCLRHGDSGDARAVRAVCLLMGGAAAVAAASSSAAALGYLNTCGPASPLAPRAPGMGRGPGALAELQGCGRDADTPHFGDSFDFEADGDYDSYDCGGFSF